MCVCVCLIIRIVLCGSLNAPFYKQLSLKFFQFLLYVGKNNTFLSLMTRFSLNICYSENVIISVKIERESMFKTRLKCLKSLVKLRTKLKHAENIHWEIGLYVWKTYVCSVNGKLELGNMCKDMRGSFVWAFIACFDRRMQQWLSNCVLERETTRNSYLLKGGKHLKSVFNFK